MWRSVPLPLFPRENGNEKGVSFADQGVRLFIDHVCWFFRCLYLYLSGWNLGGWPDGECGLSIGRLDWPADLRCRSQVSNHAGLYAGNLFDDGFAAFDWQFSLAPQYLGALYPHNLGDGIFASIGKKCLHRAFFGLSLGIVATSFGEVDGYAYNHSFMTGNLKKTMVAYGNFVREKEKKFLWEAIFMTCLIGSFVFGAIFSTYLIQFYGLETIWLVSIILTIFLIYRAIQYFEVFHFNRRHD